MILGDHECPWVIVSDHECPWVIVSDHECPWVTMSDHEWPWVIMNVHQYTLVYCNTTSQPVFVSFVMRMARPLLKLKRSVLLVMYSWLKSGLLLRNEWQV